MDFLDALPAWVTVALLILLTIWVILWFFLPFYVYAINRHLREVKAEAVTLNRQVGMIVAKVAITPDRSMTPPSAQSRNQSVT